MQIDRLDHLVLTVADLEKTCAFYEKVMGMSARNFGEGRKALAFGRQKIKVLGGPRVRAKAERPTPGSADLCFIAETPLDEVMGLPLRNRRDRGAGGADGGAGADAVDLFPRPGFELDRGVELSGVRVRAGGP